MYRNYYSVNDMPQKIEKREEKNKLPQERKDKSREITPNDNNLLSRFEKDDIILLAVILILLADDCDDKLLLLALGAVFVSGIL